LPRFFSPQNTPRPPSDSGQPQHSGKIQLQHFQLQKWFFTLFRGSLAFKAGGGGLGRYFTH
jgi:hypothetical protein